jgi:nitrate/nitrite transport system ATP-binding protein
MEIQAELGNTVIMITHDVDEAVLLSERIVMMSNGPAASIGEILDVKLDRPRDRLALAEQPEFNQLRQRVLEFLYAKQSSPADQHPKGDVDKDSPSPKSGASTATKENDENAEPRLMFKVNNETEAA